MARPVTELNPYSEGDKGPQVEAMFNHIASVYDRMNALMTFGMHTHWRSSALRELRSALGDCNAPLLDVATGTGDVTIHLRKLFPNAPVTGIDLSEGMMAVARRKVDDAGLSDISFLQADCMHLPFADNSFAAVTVAYGVRNFQDLAAGYREMCRVLKPGGRICVIELCEPANAVMRLGYRLYARTLIPLAGRLISRDSAAYSYLPRSVAACPQRRDMTELMQHAGFKNARYRVLAPGAVAIYSACK